jgi:hypothetical protein
MDKQNNMASLFSAVQVVRSDAMEYSSLALEQLGFCEDVFTLEQQV